MHCNEVDLICAPLKKWNPLREFVSGAGSELNAPATRPATIKVVRRLGTIRIMDLKGGISWKIGKYKTALREKKTSCLFFYILLAVVYFFFFYLAMTALG